MTGCDANSSFYGKGKKSVYDRVAKNPVARRQLSRCGDSVDLEELFCGVHEPGEHRSKRQVCFIAQHGCTERTV